ncbi:roadblock/LC7 domain-containing protein [Nocardia barduliensis]|uniref:roadblock/LC7 domain-containing protein n=1 Tax=Nocardia barduliensis TaxID=2736643 RepID=UPI001573CD01|nr:roadblock/LC7 domain-containing protein [Nocardia barduliensis]
MKNLDWLLDDFLGRMPGIECAVVLSTDGMLISKSSALTRENAEHFCAMASALQGLARSAGGHFGVGGVRQSVIELDRAVLFVTSAGDNACLAVLAGDDLNMGMVAYEMNQTVARVGTFLSAAPRPNFGHTSGHRLS